MSIEAWFVFLLTSFLIVATPGPVVIYGILAVSKFGLRALPIMLLGALAGDVVAVSLSLAGLGIFIQTFPQIFGLLQILGGMVIMALAIQALLKREGSNTQNSARPPVRKGKLASHIFALTALHPASYVFFASFFPMFLNQDGPIYFQLFLLGTSFIAVAMISFSAWMISASILFSGGRFSRAVKPLRFLGASLLLCVGLVSILSGVGRVGGLNLPDLGI